MEWNKSTEKDPHLKGQLIHDKGVIQCKKKKKDVHLNKCCFIQLGSYGEKKILSYIICKEKFKLHHRIKLKKKVSRGKTEYFHELLAGKLF